MTSKSYLLDSEVALEKEKKRLVHQAKLFFDLEHKILEEKINHFDKPVILDLGSGLGVYLSLIGDKYGISSLFGYERNQHLISESKGKFPNLTIYSGDLLDFKALGEVIFKVKPDVLIFRFVLHHIIKADRDKIFEFLSKVLSPEQKIFIIDTDDSKISSTHSQIELNELISRAINIQKQRGGDRLLSGKIRAEVEHCFQIEIDTTVFLKTNESGVNEVLDALMPIWNTYAAEDDSDTRLEVDKKISRVRKWFIDMSINPEFNFCFPIRIFVLSNSGINA